MGGNFTKNFSTANRRDETEVPVLGVFCEASREDAACKFGADTRA